MPKSQKRRRSTKGAKNVRIPRTVGYARVSTHEQTTAAQKQALREGGCDEVVEEISGGGSRREALETLVSHMHEGDTLMVVRLDRLGRSLPDLLRVATQLRERGVRLVSLSEGWDTETAQGRMLYAVMGALAEYERELLRERTRAALSERRRQGLPMGRPKRITYDQALAARHLLDLGRSVTAVAREMGVHRNTLYRALAELPPREQLPLDSGADHR